MIQNFGMNKMNRRSFLRGAASTLFAPAVVGSGVLMPVKRIIEPEEYHMLVYERSKDGDYLWRRDYDQNLRLLKKEKIYNVLNWEGITWLT